jgi:hypothetical protein
MAGIHVTLGRASLRGPLQLIYVGDSAAAAREAEAASVLPWILRLDNPPVVRKHNMHAEANQAQAEAQSVPAVSVEPELLEQELSAEPEATGRKKK